MSEPCPLPVSAREPNNSILTEEILVSGNCSIQLVKNCFAAYIGPTVCELEGPIPILNRSNTLIFILPLVFYTHLSPLDFCTSSLPFPSVFSFCNRFPVFLNPFLAMWIIPHHHICTHYGLHHRIVEWISYS